MGEISDAEFQEIEADLLARIREIKTRREGGSGPLAFGGAQPMETTGDSTFQIEASISGDFHDAGTAPHTTVLQPLDHHHAVANLVETGGSQAIELLDMEPGDAAPPVPAATGSGGSASRNRPPGKRASRKRTTTVRRAAGDGRVPRQPHSVRPVPRRAGGTGTRKTGTARTAPTSRTKKSS
jgi:hypothetical protein